MLANQQRLNQTPRSALRGGGHRDMGTVLEAADLDVAGQILRDSYGGNIRINHGSQPGGLRVATSTLTPQVRLDHVTFAMDAAMAADPLGSLVICHVRSGRVTYPGGRGERVYGRGDVVLPVQPDQSYTAQCTETEFEAAAIDPALLSQIADTAPGRAQRPVRFTSSEPAFSDSARVWRHTYAFVRDTVLANPATATHPLVTANAARLLVSTALAILPNNAVWEPTDRDRRDAHPAVLRRAVTFVDEHADTDITVAAIAAAAHVTIRTVQLAFRRHLDTNPMSYLRRVRLDRAHHDLLAADPTRTTIATIAHRWGFASASRFTADYRQAFGVLPRDTLHH